MQLRVAFYLASNDMTIVMKGVKTYWGGGEWKVRVVSLHSSVERKETNEYVSQKRKCTDHDVNPTIPLSQPAQWQIIKNRS
jgi:ribulose 1,5-bisphosphate synthetase/thiazole synthase